MAPGLQDIWRDLRHSGRRLARDRTFTLIAGLTLALGVGATTAIFSVLYASALAPLPYPEPDRLVLVQSVNPQGASRGLQVELLDAIREESRTLESISNAMTGRVEVTLNTDGGADRVVAEQVSFHTFEVLGVQPVLGRWFDQEEAVIQGNATPAMMISYRLWQQALGGDPDVIGKTLPGWTAGWGTRIVGVMPPGFYTHPFNSDSDVWGVLENPGTTIARLKPGVTLPQAAAELDLLFRQLDTEASGLDADDAWRTRLVPMQDAYRDGYADPLTMLLGAVGFVLLIAAVNVSNLQVNRGMTRESEMATRAALGAGRWRLFRQLIVENGLLVLAGGAGGIVVALVGIRVFVAVAPDFYPPSEEIGLAAPVLGFALALSVTTGLLTGLVPGLRASNPDLHTAIKQSGRGSSLAGRLRLRRALVVTEIGLAMVLLVGAGLMINSYARLTRVDIGMDTANVLRMDVNFNGMDRYRARHASNHYSVTPEISRFYDEVVGRLAALPGVESAASTSNLPPRGGPALGFRVVGGDGPVGEGLMRSLYHEVSPSYFSTMRIPILRGRPFSEEDNRDAAPGVVIVSETLASEYFGDADPIGQLVQVDMNAANPELENDRIREIVGVAAAVRQGLQSGFSPIMYVPYRQNLVDYPGYAYFWIHAVQDFVVRTSNDTAGVAPAIRAVFADVDPNIAVEGIMPLRQSLSAQAAGQEFWMRLLGIFAGLGVFLAAIGVYGVVSYSIEQRTHEFGIRAALGARRIDIIGLVLAEGGLLTLLGLALGLAGAWAATRQLENQLFGITRTDPVTIAAVALVIIGVSLLACLMPAMRASRFDPVRALRVE